MTLLQTIKLFINNRRLISIITIICVLAAVLFNSVSSKEYIVKTTFLLTPEESNQSLSFLKSYPLLNGLDSSGSKDALFIIADSKKIRDLVNEDIALEFNIPSKNIVKITDLKSRFNLKEEKYKKLVITYYHKNPQIALSVVQSYLNNIQYLNKTLKLTAKTNLFTIVDSPQRPENPFRPKKALNIILAIFTGLFFSSFFILIKEFYFTPQEQKILPKEYGN